MVDFDIGTLDRLPPVGTKILIGPLKGLTGEAWWAVVSQAEGPNFGLNTDGDDPGDAPWMMFTVESWNMNYAERVQEIRWPEAAGGCPPGEPGEQGEQGAAAPDPGEQAAGAGEPAEESGGPSADGKDDDGTEAVTDDADGPSDEFLEVAHRLAEAYAWYAARKQEADVMESKIREVRTAVKDARQSVMACADEFRIVLGDCPDLPLLNHPTDEPPAVAEGVAEPATATPDPPAPQPADNPRDPVAEYRRLRDELLATPIAKVKGITGPTAKNLVAAGIATLGEARAIIGAKPTDWWEPVMYLTAAKAPRIQEAVVHAFKVFQAEHPKPLVVENGD